MPETDLLTTQFALLALIAGVVFRRAAIRLLEGALVGVFLVGLVTVVIAVTG